MKGKKGSQFKEKYCMNNSIGGMQIQSKSCCIKEADVLEMLVKSNYLFNRWNRGPERGRPVGKGEKSRAEGSSSWQAAGCVFSGT